MHEEGRQVFGQQQKEHTYDSCMQGLVPRGLGVCNVVVVVLCADFPPELLDGG